MQWRFWWHLGSECLLGLFHFSFLLLLLFPFIFCLISLIFSLFTCILKYFPLFTLQVFCIYIMTSSLVFSCDSRVCEWVGLYIFMSFLMFSYFCLFTLTYSDVSILLCIFIFYFILSLRGLFVSDERQKEGGFRWDGRWRGTGRIRGRRNHH